MIDRAAAWSIAVAVLAAGLIGTAHAAQGQSSSVDLQPEELERRAPPGGQARFEFEVQNRGDIVRDLEFDYEPSFPNTTAELSPENATVLPDENVSLVLEVAVSERAPSPIWYNYTLRVSSEGNGTVWDNGTASLYSPLLGDLEVTGVRTDPEDPREGDQVQFKATVENRGDASTDRTDFTLLVDGSRAGLASIPALEAGGSTTVSSPRWDATPGEHDFQVQADPDDLVEELDEDDNEKGGTFYVPSVPTEAELEPRASNVSVAPGNQSRLALVLEHSGPDPASYDLETDPPTGGWDVAVDPVNPRLDPDERRSVDLTVEVPEDAEPGSYPIRVRALTQEARAEAVPHVNVPNTSTPQASPVLQGLSLAPDDPHANQTLRVTTHVANGGSAPAGGYSLALLANGTPVNTTSLDALAAGTQRSIVQGIPGLAEGPLSVTVQLLDPDGERLDAIDRSVEIEPIQGPVQRAESSPPRARLTPSEAKVEQAPGKAVQVQVSITNIGDEAGVFDLAVDDGPMAWSARIVPATRQLDPGETKRATVIAEIPEGTPARRQALTVTGQTAGTTETATVDVRVVEAQHPARLEIEQVHLDPRRPTAGEPVRFEGAIANLGAGEAKEASLVLAVDGVQVNATPVPSLAPGERMGPVLGTAGASPGDHTATMRLVDPQGNVLHSARASFSVEHPSQVQMEIEPTIQHAEPGSTVEFDLSAWTLRNGAVGGVLQLEGPSYGSLDGSRSLRVPSQGEVHRSLQVLVPGDATAHRELPIQVSFHPDGHGSAQARAHVRVLPLDPVELDLQEPHPMPPPGQTRTYQLRVHNPSSHPRQVPLEVVDEHPAVDAELDRRTLDLEPGESASVPLSMTASGADGVGSGDLWVLAEGGTPNATFVPVVGQAQSAAPVGSTAFTLGSLAAALTLGSLSLVAAWLHEPTRYRLLPLFSPLYSRLDRDEILDNDLRREIYEHVEANPGVHYSGIKRDLGLANGTLSHHLRILEDRKLLTSRREGRRKCFYLPDRGDRGSPSDTRTRILRLIRNQPGLSQAQVAQQLGTSRQNINYHVSLLEDEGLVTIDRDGRETELKPSV